MATLVSNCNVDGQQLFLIVVLMDNNCFLLLKFDFKSYIHKYYKSVMKLSQLFKAIILYILGVFTLSFFMARCILSLFPYLVKRHMYNTEITDKLFINQKCYYI